MPHSQAFKDVIDAYAKQPAALQLSALTDFSPFSLFFFINFETLNNGTD